MNLTVFERLIAIALLPDKGNYVTLRLMRELREKLSFSEEEIAKYGFRDGDEENGEDPMRTFWDETVDQNADIEFTSNEHKMISDALNQLDTKRSLTEDHFSLFEKFIAK